MQLSHHAATARPKSLGHRPRSATALSSRRPTAATTASAVRTSIFLEVHRARPRGPSNRTSGSRGSFCFPKRRSRPRPATASSGLCRRGHQRAATEWARRRPERSHQCSSKTPNLPNLPCRGTPRGAARRLQSVLLCRYRRRQTRRRRRHLRTQPCRCNHLSPARLRRCGTLRRLAQRCWWKHSTR